MSGPKYKVGEPVPASQRGNIYGKKGVSYWRITRVIYRGDRRLSYHSTKGWRNNRA